MENRTQSADTAVRESNELLITRDFDAPREQVWEAWSNPELFKQWWGPKNYTCPVCTIDFRVGGKFLYCMRAPDGKEIWGTGIYEEIDYLQLLVSTDSFADEKGNVVSSLRYDMDEMPLELKIFVTFEERHGKTRMTLKHLGIPAGKISEMTKSSWNESFDKLNNVMKNHEYL